jgi:hypothetical protein
MNSSPLTRRFGERLVALSSVHRPGTHINTITSTIFGHSFFRYRNLDINDLPLEHDPLSSPGFDNSRLTSALQ